MGPLDDSRSKLIQLAVVLMKASTARPFELQHNRGAGGTSDVSTRRRQCHFRWRVATSDGCMNLIPEAFRASTALTKAQSVARSLGR